MRLSFRALVLGTGLVAAFWVARPASAQFVQYTAPGSLGQRAGALEDHMKKAPDEARWSLGPVRLDPWGALKDVAFIDNVFASTDGNEVSDVTATAGAGLRAYLRTGPKVIWAAHALPEYVWWGDQTERRRWNGRYGAGVFAYFNRLELTASIRQSDLQDVVTAEFQQEITSSQVRAEITAEVELTGAISLYADGYSLEVENLTEELRDDRVPDLERLDRRERVLNTGLRWRPRRELTFGVGVEASDVQFDQQALSRSNQGTAPYFETEWDRGNLFLSLGLALRSLEPEPEAVDTFPAFEKVTGDLLLQVNLSDRLQTSFYGNSGLVYALSSDYAYFTNDLLGGSLRLQVGRRLSLRGFVEAGSLDYERINLAAPERQDDLVTLGGQLEFKIRESLTFGLGVHRSEYDSNLDVFDRTVTVLRSTVGFGSDSFPW